MGSLPVLHRASGKAPKLQPQSALYPYFFTHVHHLSVSEVKENKRMGPG